MDEAIFWQMIAQAKADSGGDDDVQVELLTEHLSQLDINAIATFDFLLRNFKDAAYRCDIWDAASLTAGGLSDDGFTDFRAWLIAQGKDIYEQVLSDPDWLAQVIVVEENELYGKHAYIELELMNYVARHAYESKTGDHHFPYIPREQAQLLGDWSSDEELPHKYPQLWAVFGEGWI